MLLLSFFPVTIVLASVVVLALVKLSRIGSRPSNYPPGPPTLPFIGNLHLIPTERPYLQMQKWAKEYGPIYSLMLGTTTMIVLSSDTSVKDLMDKRSANYSDRPGMFISQNKASGNLRLVLMRYGDQWRMIHCMIHNILNIKAAVTYVPYQDLESKVFLKDLLDDPNDFLRHLRRFTYSLSTQMIFGYRCVNNRDPKLLQLFEGFQKWSELSGSASAQLVDLYPILQKLPAFIAPNVSYAEKLFKIERQNYVGHWLQSKKALDHGEGLPCFCNDIYKAQIEEGFSDDLAGYISGSLLEAGSDTTASTLYGFIQAMLIWPKVQEKAQEEIERVVGSERLPTMEDYENMPYIRCCIKESLRWMPTVPLGIPHASLKDDEYMGYTIPKGATVINNVWGIHMDSNRSQDPRVFDPERFKDDHTTLYQSSVGDAQKRDSFVFGAGRRLCQGIHIAERTLFLGISRLLWAFNFKPETDSQGIQFQYDIEDLVGGLLVEPREYPLRIEPRTQLKIDIIRESLKDSMKRLDPVTLQWKAVPEGMAFSTWMPEKIEV